MRHPHEYDGQSGYGVPKLDAVIDGMMVLLFAQVRKLPQHEVLAQIQSELTDLNSESTRLQKDYNTMISFASIYATASKEQKNDFASAYP